MRYTTTDRNAPTSATPIKEISAEGQRIGLRLVVHAVTARCAQLSVCARRKTAAKTASVRHRTICRRVHRTRTYIRLCLLCGLLESRNKIWFYRISVGPARFAKSRGLGARDGRQEVPFVPLRTARSMLFSVPYPPLEKLGLVGDRRTAALIAADGNLCWMSLPNFDHLSLFGALLDFRRGGSWKAGPRSARFGYQEYLPGTLILKTIWEEASGVLELLDLMPLPQDDRISCDVLRRVVLRRLRCIVGQTDCYVRCEPRRDFNSAFRTVIEKDRVAFVHDKERLSFWCSLPVHVQRHSVEASFRLTAGNEVWCALEFGDQTAQWTAEKAATALAATTKVWHAWAGNFGVRGKRSGQILRSALLVHLLTFAPTGAVVASPAASLPERIGGGRNYDYRFTWIRDASLALELHTKAGSTADAQRFLQWLCSLRSKSEMPLQVLYRPDGELDAPVNKRARLYGYRGSRPVQFGNAATSIIEIDSFGYLADCVLTYLDHGGTWRPEFWQLIRRVADFTAANWGSPGAGIWEISPEQHFVTSKVMSWVTLDRALRIADKIGEKAPHREIWRCRRDDIHEEVMDKGWSEHLGSFRQRYGADALDASLLLLPIMKFLPPNHERVTLTIARIRERLEVNGFLHRFVPADLPGQGELPLGEEEGAFLMCSFWLAHVHALRNEISEAEALLQRAEAAAGPLGLFAEGVDARSGTLAGNMPLLFSQVEYAKAAMALADAEERVACSGH